MKIIITKHQGAIDWLAKQGITGDIRTRVKAEDIENQDVIGALPFYLACLTKSISVISMEIPRENKGKDISCRQMDEYGAKLNKYRVTKI